VWFPGVAVSETYLAQRFAPENAPETTSVPTTFMRYALTSILEVEKKQHQSWRKETDERANSTFLRTSIQIQVRRNNIIKNYYYRKRYLPLQLAHMKLLKCFKIPP
jgi:hypothetical protein